MSCRLDSKYIGAIDGTQSEPARGPRAVRATRLPQLIPPQHENDVRAPGGRGSAKRRPGAAAS